MANLIKRFFNLHDTSFKKQAVQCSLTSPSESQQTKQFTRFSRKQDSVKPLDKKKKVQLDTSILCYLTPKNSDETNKNAKQKLLSCKSEINLQKMSFLSPTSSMISDNNSSIQPTQKFFKRKTETAKTIKLNNSRSEAELQIQSRIICQKQSAKGLKLSRQNKMDHIRESKEKLQGSQKFKENSELKKLKNQNQHYFNLMTAKDQQIESLNKKNSQLKSQLIEARRKLKKIQANEERLLKQINEMSVKTKQIEQARCTFQKSFQKKQINYKDEIMKKIERIKYLTEVIDNLNFQLNQMSDNYNLQSSTSSINFNLNQSKNHLVVNQKQGRRAGSCYNPLLLTTNNIDDVLQDFSDEDDKHVIAQLKNQLKYCQIQVNMLKKVKLDVNKNCQQFYKLQRQNKLLKSKIFQLSTGGSLQKNKANRQNRLLSKEDKNSSALDNRYKNSQVESSDTFSLALSFSTEGKRQ